LGNDGSSGSNSSSGSSGASGATALPGQAGTPGLPIPNLTIGQPDSLANQNGQNWANPAANQMYSKEVIAPIKMICDADHLSVVPERGSGREMRVIVLGECTSDSINELVDAVWDQVESWGTAGKGNYWRPKLVLQIEPGGEQRFADIDSLLKNSGLDVEGRVRISPKRQPQPKARPKRRLNGFSSNA
jgi:hypothetical protein